MGARRPQVRTFRLLASRADADCSVQDESVEEGEQYTGVHVEGENIPVLGQHQTTLETALGIEASRMGRRPGVEDGVKA